MSNQDTCSTCGTTTGVKKDGNLWRHKNPDGIYCDNVTVESSEPQHHEVEAVPMVFSAETSTEKKSDVSVDRARTDVPKHRKPKTPVFVFVIEVEDTCPYIGDPSWEACNKMLAYKKAKDAGKRPVGEPSCAKSETVGTKRVLTYEVPVE